MANTKISEMEEATSISENDILPIVKDGSNKKASIKTVFKTVQGFLVPDSIPIGMVVEFGSDNIPTNWLLCNGQAVSRTTYSELFGVLGTSFGSGDGSTTFNLPNYKGRVAVGKSGSDTDFNALGKTGGEKKHTLTVEEMPAHQHSLSITGNGTSHVSAVRWDTVTDGRKYAGDMIDSAGGNQPHNNLQPYLVVNYIIKAKQSSGLVATVVDNLESNSTTDALSAKQGKELNEKISKIESKDWVDLTLNTGWSNLGGQYPTAQYRKIGKQVFLRGLIINNSSAPEVLLTLPEPIRPLKISYSTIIESDNIKYIYIEPNGNIMVQNYVKDNWVSLGQINYFLD